MAVDLARLHNLAEAARARAQKSQQKPNGRSWYRIENLAHTDVAEVYMYDMIGEWGVTASEFVGELRSLNASTIELHINCEGGEVFDGLAIYESLRQHKATVHGVVDGIAASAASFIAMACDRLEMAKRSRLMIHDAHGLAIGNAKDMRELADILDDLSSNIADIYAERAGGTRATWRKAMQGSNDGTWYTAEEAVKAGLADAIAGEPSSTQDSQVAASAFAWDPKEFLATIKEAVA